MSIPRYSQLVAPPHNLKESLLGYWCRYSDVKDLELEIEADDRNAQGFIDTISVLEQRIHQLEEAAIATKSANEAHQRRVVELEKFIASLTKDGMKLPNFDPYKVLGLSTMQIINQSQAILSQTEPANHKHIANSESELFALSTDQEAAEIKGGVHLSPNPNPSHLGCADGCTKGDCR